jgi:CspA family cold shock protein
MSEREFGRCKFWNDDRGFGFIRCDNGEDVFVHVSQCGMLRLEVGQRVGFDHGANPRTNKPEAKNVSVLEGSSPNGA